jgi:hypothetical protein
MNREIHLTANEIEQIFELNTDASERATMARHLDSCAECQARVNRAHRLDDALRAMPRVPVPNDLTARINAAAQTQLDQEGVRRSRMPFIAIATVFAVLLLMWFGFETIATMEDNNTLDFAAWMISHPELWEAHFADTFFAMIEILPISETLLTLFALVTVAVLAQQWVVTIFPQEVLPHQVRG